MKKVNTLGFFTFILIGINAIIGTGIFGLPGVAFSSVGPSSILVILFCIVLASVIALSFAEVAGWYKISGGPYIYVKEAFGDFIGFEVGILKVLVGYIAWAALLNFLVDSLSEFFPILVQNYWMKIFAVTFFVIIYGYANIMGLKLTKLLNNSITIAKLLPIIFFILLGIFFIDFDNFTPFFVVPNGEKTYVESFFAASLILFYAFMGFESIGVPAQEVKNPRKNIPRGILFIILIVSIIYIIILLVTIGIQGNALVGSYTPVLDAIETIFGSSGRMLMSIGIIISICGIVLIGSFLAPRFAVTMSEQGMLPPILAQKNKHGAPHIAIYAFMLSTIILSMSGSYIFLAQISVIARFAQFIPVSIATIVLRKKYKGKENKFKLPFGNLIPIFATITSIVFLYFAYINDPTKIYIGLGGIVIAIPFYFLFKRKNYPVMKNIEIDS